MKTYNAKQVAEMIKDDEVIYIGYFGNNGQEILMSRDGKLGFQKWGGWFVENFKKNVNSKRNYNYADIEFVKVKNGYASMFAYKLGINYNE